MEKLYVNTLNDSRYIALITVLDYEILLSKYLKLLSFEVSPNKPEHVLVDLALKTGIDKYSEKFNIKDFILKQIDINPNTKQKDIIEMVQDKVSEITVKRMFKKLQEEKIIENKGTKKEPIWIKLIKY